MSRGFKGPRIGHTWAHNKLWHSQGLLVCTEQAACTSRLLRPAEARFRHTGTPCPAVNEQRRRRAARDGPCSRQPQTPSGWRRQAVRDVLADYFEKKRDRLSHATVAAVLRAGGAPAAALPALVGYVAAGRSEFLRLEAAQLLLELLRPARVRPPRPYPNPTCRCHMQHARAHARRAASQSARTPRARQPRAAAAARRGAGPAPRPHPGRP